MGYFNQAFASPGMGGGSAFGMPSSMNPNSLAMMAAMQGGQGGAPQLPAAIQKAPNNAPQPMNGQIPSSPNMLQSLMSNPALMQQLLKGFGQPGAMPGAGGINPLGTYGGVPSPFGGGPAAT